MKKRIHKLFKNFKKFRKNHNSNLNIFLVCISIIMIWRGFWGLLDLYIFPDYPALSNILCIILGVFILLIDDGKLGEISQEPHKMKKK